MSNSVTLMCAACKGAAQESDKFCIFCGQLVEARATAVAPATDKAQPKAMRSPAPPPPEPPAPSPSGGAYTKITWKQLFVAVAVLLALVVGTNFLLSVFMPVHDLSGVVGPVVPGQVVRPPSLPEGDRAPGAVAVAPPHQQLSSAAEPSGSGLAAEPPAASAAPALPSEGDSAPSRSAYLRALPSFDCGRATNAVETLICSEPLLAEADARMDVVFKEALAQAVDIPQLRQEQNAWRIKQRDKCIDAPCVLKSYAEREAQIHGR